MMNHMQNLTTLNPLNIVNYGGHKVQHPAMGRSKTISQDVEGMYKEFTGFHTNMKSLVMLYKTRHQLMESLNDNRLYTAKCYNEMFDGTPLSRVVAPGKKYAHAAIEDAAKPTIDPAEEEKTVPLKLDRSSQPSFVLGSVAPGVAPMQPSFVLGSVTPGVTPIRLEDEIDTPEYPEHGVIREKFLEPNEGSMIAEEYRLSGNINNKEPEGLKSSKMMSTYASKDDSSLAELSNQVVNVVADEKKDPPSAASDPPSAVSIASGGPIPGATPNKRRESTDPPSKSVFPDDEGLRIEKNPPVSQNGDSKNEAVNDMGGSINVIVDDDNDSFTDGQGAQPGVQVIGDEKGVSKDVGEVEERVRDQVTDRAEIEEENKKGEKIIKQRVAGNDGYVPFPAVSTDEMESEVVIEDMLSSESNTDDEKDSKGGKEYLNISNDGELIVIKTPERKSQSATPSKSMTEQVVTETTEPKSQPAPQPNTMANCSYYDVHKAAYKETNDKLDEHSDLVQYVEEWERTVLKRVQSRYMEYGKHRSSLNHYTKKVGSLLEEEKKLKKKNKHPSLKQQEKLERNQVKLTGTLETHDSAGESLLLLLDEVVRRSWRDAFPLLTKSVCFEIDFAAIQQKYVTNLISSSQMLGVIGSEESISADGRLEAIQNMNPEDIYTGSRTKYSQGKSDE